MNLRPTAALANGILLAAVVAALAILAHRPDLLILVAPLVVYACWGLARRPRFGRARLASSPFPRITEGKATPVDVKVETSDPGSVTVAWPPQPGLRTSPTWGIIVGPSDAPLRLKVRPPRWGRYAVESAFVTAHDAAGAWRATFPALTGPVISVVPQTATLIGPDGVADPVGVAGPHRSGDRGDGSELADLREFRAGDRVRRINWRVTARRGVPYVVTTYLDEDTDVIVLADTTADIPADDGSAGSLDTTMRAVAAITRYYCGLGDRIAVHDFGRIMGSVPPGTGMRQAKVVVDAISRADTERWTIGADARPLRRVRPGTLVFVVSPLLEPAIFEQIGALRAAGAYVVVVDTFGAKGGTAEGLSHPDPDGFTVEAVTLRRLGRGDVAGRLRAAGIPAATWEGPASLGGVLLAMSQMRSAPRMRSAR